MGIRTQALRGAVLGGLSSPRPPARLRDRFELLVKLGSGGFGTVWEGFDMLLERPVAVKELRIDGELSGVGDALREARATARLNHPAIVSLYEIVAEDDRIFMISELVHGRTLDELIGDGLLADQDVGRIGLALCEALAHAHGHGVVHRDVKPANVMVPDEWLEGVSGWRAQPAKLMDFGIAGIADSEAGRGPHAGSRGYVAPEQEAGAPASPASDVFSLATMLYECFVGALPGHGRRGKLAKVRRDLPPALSRCVDECLRRDPVLRPTLAELKETLEAALPLLADELTSHGVLSWLRRVGFSSRRSRGRSAEVSGRTGGQADRGELRSPRAPVGMRLSAAALAAAVTASTLAFAQLRLSAAAIGIAAAIVAALPRTGWPVAGCVGGVALIAVGQDGTAFGVLSVACVCAFAAALTSAGHMHLAWSMWAAALFVWIIAMQSVVGEGLILSLPRRPPGAAVRESLPAALDAARASANAAYGASLMLWMSIGCIAAALWNRRSALRWWVTFATVGLTGQILLADALGAPVPPITILAAVLVLVSAPALAAAAPRRAGRVFGAT